LQRRALVPRKQQHKRSLPGASGDLLRGWAGKQDIYQVYRKTFTKCTVPSVPRHIGFYVPRWLRPSCGLYSKHIRADDGLGYFLPAADAQSSWKCCPHRLQMCTWVHWARWRCMRGMYSWYLKIYRWSSNLPDLWSWLVQSIKCGHAVQGLRDRQIHRKFYGKGH